MFTCVRTHTHTHTYIDTYTYKDHLERPEVLHGQLSPMKHSRTQILGLKKITSYQNNLYYKTQLTLNNSKSPEDPKSDAKVNEIIKT